MLMPLTPLPLTPLGTAFRVMQPEAFDPEFHRPEPRLASRKVNGVRCLIHLQKGETPTYYSKTGREITGLSALDAALLALNYCRDEIVLDGELTLATPDGSDDFSGILGAIQRKNYHIPHPQFYAFDLLTTKEFTAGRCDRPYFDRQDILATILRHGPAGHPVQDLPQRRIETPEGLDWCIAKAASHNWEGLVIRTNSPYRAGHTEDALKVKQWRDLEAPVIGYTLAATGVPEALQVQLGGRDLIVREGLTPARLASLSGQWSQLLNCTITIAFGPESLTPRCLAVYVGERVC